jgi:hypothetical protein
MGKRTDHPRRSQQVSAAWLGRYNGSCWDWNRYSMEVGCPRNVPSYSRSMHRTLTVNAVQMKVGRQALSSTRAQSSAPMARQGGNAPLPISLTSRSLALQSGADRCLPIAATARQEGRLSFSYLLTGISVRVSCGPVVSFALTAPNRRGACLLWWRGFPFPPTHRKSERASAHRIPFREPIPLNWSVTASKVHWLASTILRRLRLANVRYVLDFQNLNANQHNVLRKSQVARSPVAS